MGLSDGATAEAIKDLPAPISVAYGAYGRNLQDWVEKARQEGHEVLLQIPLEPLDYPTNDPGPHTLLPRLLHPVLKIAAVGAIGHADRRRQVLDRFGGGSVRQAHAVDQHRDAQEASAALTAYFEGRA